jgi:hypothetical protein
MSRVPVALSAAGIRFSGHPLPAGGLGLPHGRLTGLHPDPNGIPRFTRTSYDRVGCPLNPGDSGAHTTGICSPAAACRFTTATSLHPGPTPSPGGLDNEASSRVYLRSPVRSSPCL